MNKLLATAALASLVAASSALAQTTETPSPSPAEKTDSATPPAATTPATPAPAVTDTPAATPSVTTPDSSSDSASTANPSMTDDEAKTWINKVVYSSDDKNLGEVAAFARDSSGKVSELHADIGGFLGLGETRVRVMPTEFKLMNDRVVLNMTADQAKALPKIAK